MNKTNQYRLDGYLESETRFLHECYGRCSEAKEKAFKDCMAWMWAYHGARPRIITASRYRFTFGFLYLNETTGDPMMMYIGSHKDDDSDVEQMLVPINLKGVDLPEDMLVNFKILREHPRKKV